MYYEELGQSIDCVINSAAVVKHYGNSSIFNDTNISGTQNLISFCLKFNCKLMHLSTLSVSGNIFDKKLEVQPSEVVSFTEKNLYINQDLSNIYIKTKFLAVRFNSLGQSYQLFLNWQCFLLIFYQNISVLSYTQFIE